MKLRDELRLRARALGRRVEDGVTDSGQVAVYLRQLLRGNRAAPSSSNREASAQPSPRGASQPPWPPVLLIHGYMANRGSVHLLESRLTRLGHVVITYPLGPLHLGDIRESAGFIQRKVESLIHQTGVPQIDIVAHSMGGLVALDYVKRLGGAERTRKLVLLGTPIRGTWAAALGLVTAPFGRASLQLLPGSTFLRELLQTPLPSGPEITAIAAERDWLAPPRTTLMSGVHQISVATGHTGLLVDEQIAFRVADVLAAPGQTAPGNDHHAG